MDLVATCPKSFWDEWLEEGDCAGDPESGQLYGWHTGHPLVVEATIGDRFYVVAHGKLRGYALVADVHVWHRSIQRQYRQRPGGVIYRAGGAVAVTIPQPIPSFRGLRKRWWRRDSEVPFLDFKTP